MFPNMLFSHIVLLVGGSVQSRAQSGVWWPAEESCWWCAPGARPPTPTMTLVGQLRVDESHWWGVACGGWDSHCTVGSRAYVARTDTHQVGAAVTVYKDHCFRWDSRLMDGRHARQQTPMPMMTLVVESRVGESPSSSTPRSVLQQTAAGGRGSVLEGGRLLGLAAVWARRWR